jgi:glycosyltransferase involved in cell wall biosynthesis
MHGLTSVVIPCYDSQGFLEEALASIQAQTTPVREIIVVDDGSPTPIHAPAAWKGPPLQIVRTTNQKSAAARNHGLQLASGKFVAFIDADDLWLPEKIARQEKALSADHTAVACYTRCTEEPGFFSFGPYPPADVSEEEFLRVLWYNNFFPPSSVLVRRQALLDTGGFLDRLGTGAEDLELWIRLLELGRFVQVAEPLCRYRKHIGQFTNDIYAKVMSNKLARRAILERQANRLVSAGIPRAKLWNAHRNVIRLVYYRRDFSAARKLLWDYWTDHPLDVRMFLYACITLLPSRFVSRFRGQLSGAAIANGRHVDNAAAWRQTLAEIHRDLTAS